MLSLFCKIMAKKLIWMQQQKHMVNTQSQDRVFPSGKKYQLNQCNKSCECHYPLCVFFKKGVDLYSKQVVCELIYFLIFLYLQTLL
jgi:hypothetical protein